MGKAARAIIIKNDKILVMQRNKQGGLYYTLVGGRVDENEEITQGLIREVKEETGLDITTARYVFYEEHAEPYNEQYIFLCDVTGAGDVKIQDTSEEAALNRVGVNTHTPMWANVRAFDSLAFRTPQLQKAILDGIKHGFPSEPQRI